MDWSKIKTILIGVLLVTNILLGVTFYQSNMRFVNERQEQLDRVLTLMETRNITLSGIDLDFPTFLNSIDVSYEKFDDTLIEKLLGSSYENIGNQYMSGHATITMSEIAFYYEKFPLLSSLFDNTLPSVEVTNVSRIANTNEVIDQFISLLGLANDYNIEHIYLRDDYIVVTAKQVYKEYTMDDALMVFVIDNDDVIGFRRIWLDINSDITLNKYDIISVDRALYVTMPKLKSGDVIDKVDISYKLNDSSSVVSNLVSGEALPFYRIETADGAVFYVRAIVER